MSVPFRTELAGLGAAALWAGSAMAWGLAGRRVGSVAVTAIRTLLALGILTAVHLVLTGRPIPWDVDPESLLLLAASGAVGAGFGDLCMFRAFVLIGPRLGMLILALSPIVTALIAYVTPLREGLGPVAVAGIVLATGGVLVVVADRPRQAAWRGPPDGLGPGLLLSLAGTVLISAGFVLSRMGMQAAPRLVGEGLRPAVDAFSATVLRIAAATVITWGILPLLGRARSIGPALRDRRALATIAVGTVIGPVLGIWLSMVALGAVKSAVAVALINLSPVMMIPLAWLGWSDRPTGRSIAGTALAVAGVVVLLLRDPIGRALAKALGG